MTSNGARAVATRQAQVPQPLRVTQRFVVMAKGEIIDRGATDGIDADAHRAALAF